MSDISSSIDSGVSAAASGGTSVIVEAVSRAVDAVAGVFSDALNYLGIKDSNKAEQTIQGRFAAFGFSSSKNITASVVMLLAVVLVVFLIYYSNKKVSI